MKGFVGDIAGLTEKNTDFRRVLYTGKNLQLVLMSIPPGGEIGEEVHKDRDQFFRVEEGAGEVLIDGKRSVRRQNIWDDWQRNLREVLAPLVGDVRRPADGAASVGLRWSVV